MVSAWDEYKLESKMVWFLLKKDWIVQISSFDDVLQKVGMRNCSKILLGTGGKKSLPHYGNSHHQYKCV